eukprot:gnl/MRDRNA2_/MRDRNA2_16446_c0_seq1.p1 gnl/MRDRNA2_/MRDRNA2_16446_c0~~gnl/MRDRNA2_/MRDRNA2_16446_c0_seq1.p1  ORF type:complete len:127 (-),score=21.21 gnl/MRDRNA2_/MRDRNA2_16446_c0_seq1:182-562(-)
MDRSLLHRAAVSGSATLIAKALNAGCPVNAMSKGFTALHLLVRSRHDNPEAVRALLQAQADLNSKSGAGNNTPLEIAIKNCATEEIIRLLGGNAFTADCQPSKASSTFSCTVADLSEEQRAMLFLG